jgi:hypothetical protein
MRTGLVKNILDDEIGDDYRFYSQLSRVMAQPWKEAYD